MKNNPIERLILGILAGGFMYAVMTFIVIPRFFNDVQKAAQQNIQNAQNIAQAANAKQAKDKADRETQLTKPVYVEKEHKGVIKRTADVRTCALSACTVVGKLPPNTSIMWGKNDMEKDFIRYDEVHWVRMSDVNIIN